MDSDRSWRCIREQEHYKEAILLSQSGNTPLALSEVWSPGSLPGRQENEPPRRGRPRQRKRTLGPIKIGCLFGCGGLPREATPEEAVSISPLPSAPTLGAARQLRAALKERATRRSGRSGLVEQLCYQGVVRSSSAGSLLERLPGDVHVLGLETLAPLLNAAPHAGPALSHAADTAVSVAPAGVLRLTMLFLAGMPLMLCNVAVPVALLVPELCPGRGLAGAGIEPRLGAMIVAAMPSCTLLPYQNAPFLIALSISRDIVKERHFVACLLGNALIGYLAVPGLQEIAWFECRTPAKAPRYRLKLEHL
eukprot:g19290.t1